MTVEELMALDVEEEKTSIDSLKLQAIADSTQLADAEQARLALERMDFVHDSLNNLVKLNDMSKIEDTHIGPISSVYASPENREILDQEIQQKTVESIFMETDTDVLDEVGKYNSLREDLIAIHEPFQEYLFSQQQKVIPPQYGGGLAEIDNILENESLVKLSGANSLDKAWPSRFTKRTKEEWHEMGGFVGGGVMLEVEDAFWEEDEVDFRNATVARLVASDPEIKKIVYGTPEIDDTGQAIMKSPGFLDVLVKFGLSGESTQWEWMKEKVGSRSNALDLLDWALKAKKAGYDYFFSPFLDKKENYDDYLLDNTLKGPGVEFTYAINQFSEKEKGIVLETLQNMVNGIYSKGLVIEEKSQIMLDEYYRLKDKFPKREGYNTDVMTNYDNEDLFNINKKQQEINSLMNTYKSFTGEDYNLYGALNNMAIQTLQTELDSLPDVERTEALNEWLIEFGDSLQEQNRW